MNEYSSGGPYFYQKIVKFVVSINIESTPLSDMVADFFLKGKATEILGSPFHKMQRALQ